MGIEVAAHPQVGAAAYSIHLSIRGPTAMYSGAQKGQVPVPTGDPGDMIQYNIS